MSVSFGCKCEERKKPIAERLWRVLQRCCNHSAFNGYHHTRSDYSTVLCLNCNAIGRTKADYVASLANMSAEEKKKWYGFAHVDE